MKKIIFIIILFPFWVTAATPKQDSILNNKINKLEIQLNEFKKETKDELNSFDAKQKIAEETFTLTDRAFNGISNQLSAAMYVLAIIGVFGVILGVYINNKAKQVGEIKKNVEETLGKIERINDGINNNKEEFYKEIKRNETLSFLDRLIEVPEDIINIFPILASRKLQKNDFSKFTQAYHKSKECERGDLINYYQELLF